NGTMHAGNTEASAEAYVDGQPWSDEDAAVPISSKDPMWGSRSAPVTLVLFSDFQCPFCGRVEQTMTQLKEKYGPEKLRVIWKNNPLPFHKDATPAAIAAETVFRLGGNKAFWKFHDLAFQNQRELTPEHFQQWAQQSGVDVAKWKAAFDKQEYKAKVESDTQEGSRSGVSGTPASFINGVFLSGAQPIDKFTSVIDEQLAAAKQKIASGVKPDKVYAALSKENKAKAPPPDKRAEQKRPEQDDKTVWKVPVGSSPVRGNKDALVTLVLFSDFQCPFCGRVEPTLAELEKTYGDKLRIVWKNNPLPFHPHAEPSAELAWEARAEKKDAGFWAAHDMLFKNQQKEGDDDLLGYAKELGLDVDKVKAAITEHKYKHEFEADQELADDLQASGTPHMFINGRRLVGAQPIEKFKTIIDEEIKHAQELVAKGTPASKVYEEIIKDGKQGQALETKTTEAPAADSPVKGNAKAKVVMEIFSDFQCPFCKRVEETLKQVEEQYGKQVKFVWRHKPLPMHKDAPLAAEAAQEIYKEKGNEGFWKMHDLLFEKQGSSPEALQRPALESYAEQVGADMSKFKKALDDHSNKAFVDSESAVADKAGISGTPAFVIGQVKGKELTGYFVSGAQPFSKFKKAIDTALKDAGEKPGDKAERADKGEKKGETKPAKATKK
ncbi:MAG TPA: thioredoxin domain-containing protein, partial [Minicystis sp.]|nr:thioredoxin domain-containing protein [Minicystis sp.]